jgi:hypothetical protein
MTQRPIRSIKPSRIIRENLESPFNSDSIDDSTFSDTINLSSLLSSTLSHASQSPSFTMAPPSAAQRELLAAEKAEERLQQLHDEDLKIRRAQAKEYENRAADRERKLVYEQKKLVQEQEDRTETLRIQKQQEDRATELHALSLAAVTARASAAESAAILTDEPGELLPSSASILNVLLPGVPNKEILKVFRGTFLPNNLSRLRIHQLWSEPQNDVLIVNSVLSMRPKEGTAKDYPSVEVWIEGFLNYTMILIVMCKNLATDLIPQMLAFSNQITWLSATYQITPLITMALEHHAMVIQKNQLEPANWKIPSNFLDIYCNASTHKSASIASKRARATTDISRTCHTFNKGSCNVGKNCKFPHTCSKCGGPHAARYCK